MDASDVAAFNSQAAQTRRAVWPVSVKLSSNAIVAVSKSPTRLTRERNLQDSGWVQRAISTFLFDAAGAFAPAIGNEWTITASPDVPSEVNTRWRCFDLTPASVGAEHRCVCFRLD